jgi:hypothetical protein
MGRENYRDYPDCDDQRSGCKVGWRYYRDRKAAEECAEAAKHNARIDASLGYDFGYCAPGSIDWSEKRQMHEVCIP